MNPKQAKFFKQLDSVGLRLVEGCQKNGMLEMFSDAVLKTVKCNVPKDMCAYFFQFVLGKKPAYFSLSVEQEFARQFGSAVDLFEGNNCGVVMVVCNGVPRHFVPTKELREADQVTASPSRQTSVVPARSLFDQARRIESHDQRYPGPSGAIRVQPRV